MAASQEGMNSKETKIPPAEMFDIRKSPTGPRISQQDFEDLMKGTKIQVSSFHHTITADEHAKTFAKM